MAQLTRTDNQINKSEKQTIIRNQRYSYIFFERLTDILGAVIGLILALPLIVVICTLYLFEDTKGPIFFRQVRVGKNGVNFDIYKFRSMAVDAQRRLKADPALYRKYIENNYKLDPEEDPRITRLGRFLRKTSLDELPQLINVLKGEMSLVGPRPVIEEELEEYKDKIDKFLSVKPGVTGYWQVSGRSDVGYPERVDLELYYVNKQSITFDIKILLKTVLIVILKKGAY